jgi:PAS domain S-box-containing protein
MKDRLDRECTAAPSGGQLPAPEDREERLCQLTEEVRDHAIVLLDPQGIVTSWHDGAKAVTGYEAHEIIGTHFSRFYRQDAVDGAWPELELRVAAIQGRFGGAGWRVRHDGSHYWAEVALMALRDRDGELRGFGHLITDIAQPGRPKPLPDVARQMNELIAMLSHEFRNPLAPIRNAVYLMRRKQLTNTERQSLLSMLDRHSAQLVRLVDDLMDMSRLTQGTIRLHSQALDIASVVARAVEASRSVIDAHAHTLRLALPEEPVQLTGDCVRLVQVIVTLLDNAARYTPPGGEIRVAVKLLDRQVEISVRDTGVGMAPELLAKAFDLFTRGGRPLERSEGGLGVGLALARGLVELHGGQLEAQSAGRDKGSEFLMRLPVSGPVPALPTVAVQAPVDGADPQPGIRGVDPSPQKRLERHVVKPRYWAALRRLLSDFQSPGTLLNDEPSPGR